MTEKVINYIKLPDGETYSVGGGSGGVSGENDTLPLFYNFYSSEDMTTTEAYVNASSGSYLSGNTWKSAYNKLINRIGESFCSGTVKAYGDDTITEYDCVVNQDDMTFRLPLLNGSENLPSTRIDNLILGVSGSTYTASANGWYYIAKLTGQNYGWVNLKNQTTGCIDGRMGHNVSDTLFHSIFCKKGEVMEVVYQSNGTVNEFKFIHAQGNGSLYFKLGNTLQSIPDEYVTETELETKGYLTLVTLPIWDGGNQ